MRNIRSTRAVTLLALLLAMLAAVPIAFAQEESEPETDDEELFVPLYTLGDQTLSINLGLFAPLFYALGPDGVEPANLSLGGAGSLAWGSYITNELKLGVEVAGSFAFTPNGRGLYLVPIAANANYIFQAYPFEFPLNLGLGLSFARLDDMFKVDPFVKGGGSVYWNHSAQWAFGLNLNYWFIPQIYLEGSSQGAEESRLGNFLEITLSALYHF
ncbi:MAG: TP0733 family outer membrane beta-barrel protein [Spirochaetota bacterium]